MSFLKNLGRKQKVPTGRYSYRGARQVCRHVAATASGAGRTRRHGYQRQHHPAPQPIRNRIRLLLHAGITRNHTS